MIATNADQLPLPLRDQTTVDEFILGACNEEAHQALMTWSERAEESPDIGGRLMALTGPLGSGKSRLLREVVAARGGEVITPDAHGALPAVSGEGLVALDNADEAEGMALFSVYNRIASGGGLFLLTGTGRPTDWGRNGPTPPPDLINRLSVLPEAELESPDQEMLTECVFRALHHARLAVPREHVAKAVEDLARRFPAAQALVEAALHQADVGARTGRILLERALADIPAYTL